MTPRRTALQTGTPGQARSRRAWAARLLALLGMMLIVSVYAAGSFASASVLGATSNSANSSNSAISSTSATTSTSASSAPSSAAALTAAQAPAVTTGVCTVPGIGDIGGLLGLCSSGSSGLIGDLNNVCQPSLPQPEPAVGGIDSLIEPPASAAAGHTLYDSYGMAGQFWAAHGLQCSDMTSLIGNNVANMVFDAAKSIDRVTITVYQSAAGNGILNWLQSTANRLISALGNAIYFPYLAPVIILGAIWMAWNGLVRKRATRAIEGTLWMVVACAAAIWLIGRPADFTGVGTTVSNGVTQVLNVAFAKLPNPGGSNCVPVQGKDPQIATGNFSFTSSNGLVDQNANELWSVLVCKPWLDGELGTTQYATTAKGPQTVVNQYGRQLLWSQAIAVNEKPTSNLIQAKQATYNGIANDLQKNNPGVYPLFQGNQWTTRLEIGFAAMFAALVAGLLILLISLTLIILKLGFLLLLIAGPFFLIIGTHPGFGRIIAIRWFEMLVGVLMKQVAVALALSVLLYCYSLIMGTTDAVLPWALKILMIALVTVAVFIYRKPFQHLFSAVGYGAIGSQERADVSLRQASTTFRRATRDTATATVPGVAAYRVGRWARHNPGEAAALAAGIVGAAGAVGAGSAASKAMAGKAAASAAGAAGAGGAGGAATDEPAERLRAHADGQPSRRGRGRTGGPGRTAHGGRARPPLARAGRESRPAHRAPAQPAPADRGARLGRRIVGLVARQRPQWHGRPQRRGPAPSGLDAARPGRAQHGAATRARACACTSCCFRPVRSLRPSRLRWPPSRVRWPLRRRLGWPFRRRLGRAGVGNGVGRPPEHGPFRRVVVAGRRAARPALPAGRTAPPPRAAGPAPAPPPAPSTFGGRPSAARSRGSSGGGSGNGNGNGALGGTAAPAGRCQRLRRLRWFRRRVVVRGAVPASLAAGPDPALQRLDGQQRPGRVR